MIEFIYSIHNEYLVNVQNITFIDPDPDRNGHYDVAVSEDDVYKIDKETFDILMSKINILNNK